MQPHTFGVPPPPHVFGEVHVAPAQQGCPASPHGIGVVVVVVAVVVVVVAFVVVVTVVVVTVVVVAVPVVVVVLIATHRPWVPTFEC